jgi:hypothetical protein
MFVSYVELKIEGSWEPVKQLLPSGYASSTFDALTAKNSEGCMIHLIEPDGLRRVLQFTEGATITLHQNILSYHPQQVQEMIVDEKAQSGKGKTRDTLS